MSKINIDLEKELKKCKTTEDLTGKNGLIQRLLKDMMEHLLENEMEEHLGYEKHSSKGDHTGNSRNGKSVKNVNSSFGPLEIEVPRDRNSEFEPQVIKKRQKEISSFDEKITQNLKNFHSGKESFIPTTQAEQDLINKIHWNIYFGNE